MTKDDLVNASRFTVLIGKNGAGKSTLLRSLNSGDKPHVKYVSPERGGSLKYDPNVDSNMSTSDRWLKDSRQTNRFEQFRQQSAVQFRMLETAVLREIEKNAEKRADITYTFDSILEQINLLLPAIRMVRNDKGGFSIQTKAGQAVDEASISSGESELIALAIEVLVFSYESLASKVLLLDEPDVHLHPDLQQRFTAFVESTAIAHDLRVVIATHSTAIIGAFSKDADLQIVPVSHRDQTTFSTFSRSKVCEEILPIFGAHPLSSNFNKSPIVLVEGEDDRRVLEQVVRSSNGRFVFTPCVVGTVNDLNQWEEWLSKFLPVLYDAPQSYSLRDLDQTSNTEINDIEGVYRIKLNCYAMENLLLTDQVLEMHGFTCETFKAALSLRVEKSPEHRYSSALQVLLEDFENRRIVNIKDVRNLVVAELGSNKPWEVIVGQAIATKVSEQSSSQNSIQNYLGAKAMTHLFG